MKKRQHKRIVGLLGGSFDPAHAGHLALSQHALRSFGLDRVWWMVSPGNPLKQNGPAPMAHRIETARRLVRDPRIVVTDIEARTGTRYTAHTLSILTAQHPNIQFVWLMGADNLIQFDRWRDWRTIFNTVPIGVLARPGSRLAPLVAKAARIYAPYRLPASQARLLPLGETPRWCYINMPLHDISSTQLRQGS